MLHIMQLLFAFSFDIKLGRLGEVDLRDREDNWIAAEMGKDIDSAIRKSLDRYNGIELRDTTLSDDFLIEMLICGVVDKSLLKRDLDASTWFLEQNVEPSWRTIWHRLKREDDAVVKAISTLQSEMADFHYRDPGEILHIFGIMLMIIDAEMIPVDRDSVIHNAKAYIIALRKKGKLYPLKSNTSIEDYRDGSWRGLGFLENGTPHFGVIYTFLQDQCTQAGTERLPILAKQLMTELDNDPDLFYRRLVGIGGPDSDLIVGPVLKEINPNNFLDAVLRQPARVQYDVFRCLLSRHRHGKLYRELEEERPWAKALHEAMLHRAETAEPVRRDKLKTFARWVGQNVQDAADGDEAQATSTD